MVEIIRCDVLSKVFGVQVEYVDESILIKKTGHYLTDTDYEAVFDATEFILNLGEC
jgi:hypothetical protein